jgi:hypothetical protein
MKRISIITILVLLTVFTGSVSAGGSIKCGDLLAGDWEELKIDQSDLELSTYPTLHNLSVTINEILRNDENEIIQVSWTATRAIDAVIFKAGADGFVEYYEPPATSGTNSHDDYGNNNALSHLSFCYVANPTAVSLATFTANEGTDWQWGLTLVALLSLVTLAYWKIRSFRSK